MPKRHYILSIDQGTTGNHVLVIDDRLKIVGRAYREFPQHFPKPGWVEHSLEEIWASLGRCIALAVKDAGIKASALDGIGITNQRETTCLWDRETGESAHPAIVWQDRRTADLCAKLKAEGHEPDVRKITGLVLDPYFSASKLSWLLDRKKALRKKAEKGRLCFGTVDSWLVNRLTGGRAHVTDVSNASRTLLMNLRSLEWDPRMLELFGVPSAVLPEIRSSAEIYGLTSGVRGLPDGIPVAGMAGDQQAALFGQACFSPGESKCTYGTGAFLLMNTGTRPVPSEAGLLTTVAWKLGETTSYALEGSSFIAGAAVQWLRDGLGIIANAAETEALAASAPNNGGVYFVPALAGLGAPHWDAHARGLLVGITRGTGRAEIARAVLESIAYRTRDLTLAMERESGVALSALRCDGGGSANNFLMQFQADMLGVPVEVPALADVTALGAACLAGIATGFWSVDTAPFADRLPMQRYEPNMPDTTRQALYERWLNALARARDWAV